MTVVSAFSYREKTTNIFDESNSITESLRSKMTHYIHDSYDSTDFQSIFQMITDQQVMIYTRILTFK